MPDPALSVVIPLYNKEKDVRRPIRSVLSQSFQNYEIIVVNDGSTDKGSDVLRSYEDPRIRVLDQPNQGVSAARNRGIAESKAGLIAFLDADDEWEDDYLETILRLVDKFPAASVFATGYTFRHGRGSERRAILRGLPENFSEGILQDYFIVAAQSDPPLCSSTVTLRKQAIESIGGFPVGVATGEDLLTWARLAVRYGIAFSVQPKAGFWMPVNVESRPGRVPSVPDTVGSALSDLLGQIDLRHQLGLRQYIALWHTMRAATYIQLADGRAARKELHNATSMDGPDIKRLLLFILALLPGNIGRVLYQYRQRLKS